MIVASEVCQIRWRRSAKYADVIRRLGVWGLARYVLRLLLHLVCQMCADVIVASGLPDVCWSYCCWHWFARHVDAVASGLSDMMLLLLRLVCQIWCYWCVWFARLPRWRCCVWFDRYDVVTVASGLTDMVLLLLRPVCQIWCCYCCIWKSRCHMCRPYCCVWQLAEVLMCIIVVSESLPNIIMSVLKLLLVLEGCQIY